jgi:hypothetical protein
VHHRDPWNVERGINHPLGLATYGVCLPILWFPFLPTAQAMTGMAASWIAFVIYEWVHFVNHSSYTPRTWLFRRIRRNHRLHHFKNDHYWFNVSTIGVDSLCGTAPPAGSVPTTTHWSACECDQLK